MKGRAVLALAAVSLLLLPLLGLVFLWFRGPAEREVEGWRFAPGLSPAEFRERRTFRQPCQEDAQCEPPLICAHELHGPRPQCTGSACTSDQGCAPYGVCRSIPVRGQRVAIRECVFEGTREEGEPCLRSPRLRRREWACGEGLVCGGSGWCGRRCVPGKEGTCPEGFFCARGDPDGPVCQPACEGRTCPEGQECIRREGGVSVCARVNGLPCHEKPCPGDQVCETETLIRFVGEAARWCVQVCGQDGAGGCPEGSRCHRGLCRWSCAPGEPESCGALQFCVSTGDEGNGVCLASPEQWILDAGPARDGG